MNYFLNVNKNWITYSLIGIMIIPFLGINFFISFIGNILLLLLLIPLFLLLLVFISFNTYKSKLNRCDDCGAIFLGSDTTCMNCGSDLRNVGSRDQLDKKPSESIIEVKAEEII